jgi:prepilin-type N-terminal cleavage/methylation domain-containing protein
MMALRAQSGFSLVELSIVLVILGLLTGGILAGQSLIRAAELRSIATDTAKYISATYSFRDKYLALPGDMPNAVRFWQAQAGGTADGTDATCMALTTPATDARTCNGNGNGMVADAVPTNHELFRFWQHLANAGLIEGQYTGISAATTYAYGKAGENVARGRLPNSGYMMLYYYPISDPTLASHFVSPMGNLFWLGGDGGQYTDAPILKPDEAWNVDTKLDDGRPAQGTILVRKSATTCHTSTTPSLAEYALSVAQATCALMIRTGI